MVTLVETKSESRTRRTGRLRGGVCGSAEKSVESAQSVDRHRVTESYPLGGNGVAARTTNYPGAAARTRIGGGTGFRGVEAVFSSRNAAPLNIYYDSNWQAIEVRTNGTAATNVTSQTVWSAAYINAPVLQDTYVAGVLVPNSRLYFQQDANWDTTAVVGYNATTGTWGVVQRYVYSPYGNIIILNPNFTLAAAGTTPLVQNLYQGMLQDPVSGLYYERARWYSPSLGTWISQDPLQYINGANTYQFVGSNPVGRVDAEGLAGWLPLETTRGELDQRFMSGYGTFRLDVSRLPPGLGWGSTSVYVYFLPARKLSRGAGCRCREIKLVQFAASETELPFLPGGGIFSGWHLDDAGIANNFLGCVAPFFKQQTPWRLGGGLPWASSYDTPGPPGHLHFDLLQGWLTLFFNSYAVCTKGDQAGVSYGKVAFELRFSYPGLFESGWWAKIRVYDGQGFFTQATYISGTTGHPFVKSGIRPIR